MLLAGPALVLLGTLAVDAPPPAPSGPVDVVVTAAPPLDAERLADALRAYLDEYGVRVESAGATDRVDLRRQLAEARQLGQQVRAVAVVRVQRGDGDGVVGGDGDGDGAAGAGDARRGGGMIEIDVVDLATEKVLIAELARPARVEDLYRALALKIQASLRVTLSEAPERLGTRAGLVRLAGEGPAARDANTRAGSDEAAAHASLETGYLLFAFPLGGVGLQGLSLSAALTLGRWLDVTLGTAVLGAARGEAGGVTAVGTVVPVLASARLRLGGGRLQGMVGPAAAITYVAVSPSSAVTAVRATRYVVPALGADAEGRLQVSAAAWVYARITALGVLLGERYVVAGQPVLDTSRLQASASAGLGLTFW